MPIDARLSERLPRSKTRRSRPPRPQTPEHPSVGVQKLQAELRQLREQVIKKTKSHRRADVPTPGTDPISKRREKKKKKKFAAAAEENAWPIGSTKANARHSRLADAKGSSFSSKPWARTRQTLQALDAKAPEHNKGPR